MPRGLLYTGAVLARVAWLTTSPVLGELGLWAALWVAARVGPAQREPPPRSIL